MQGIVPLAFHVHTEANRGVKLQKRLIAELYIKIVTKVFYESEMNLPPNDAHIEKTLNLLEFDRIRETAASCALSGEAAKLIREEIPLFDPEKVRLRKNLVSSFCELIKNSSEEKRQELPETGFLLPSLSVDGSILDADEVLALGLFLER